MSIIRVLVSCFMLVFMFVGSASAGTITWIEHQQNNVAASSGYSQQQLQHAKKIIINKLIQKGAIYNDKNHSSPYRAVKIFISTEPKRTGAWVYLYSPTYFTFKKWFIPLTQDLSATAGDIQTNPKYEYRAEHTTLDPVCPNANIKALLFFPTYFANNINAKPTMYMDRKMYDIAQKVKARYPGATEVLYGYSENRSDSATKANFLNYMSCPNLEFVMHVGGEDTDPENRLWAGTSFYTADPTVKPVTSADLNALKNISSNLQTVILAGCHFFTNNTSSAMCPFFANKNKFPKLDIYSGGQTALPIPSAMQVYDCFIDNMGTSTSNNSNVMQQCASKYEPYLKNSTSTKIYINSRVSQVISVTGKTSTATIAQNDTIMLDVKDAPYTVKLGSNVLSMCGMKPNNAFSLKNPGSFVVHKDFGSNVPCIQNDLNDLPIAELPSVGSGVIYGLRDATTNSQSCTAGQSNFSVNISPAGTAECLIVPSNLSFTIKGTYADKEIYKPVTDAANKANQDPASVTLTYKDGKFSPLFGFHYTGLWNMQEPTNITNLPANCVLSLDATEKTILDLAGDGATIHMSIKNK